MLKRVEQFLKHETDKAKQNNIEVYWSTGKFLWCDGLETCGYFCEEPKRLAVATGTPMSEWLPIFVHESCHMDQWLERVPFWNDGEKGNQFMEKWLKGKDYPEDKVYEFMQMIILLEEDCERRSVAKIKEWNLPIDIDRYIRGANVYLFFYLDMMRTRSWSKGAYRHKRLLNAVSKKFYKNYKKMPRQVKKVFEDLYTPPEK